MPLRTLLQQKNRPVHKLKPTKAVVPFTWCGVDPCRKGVRCEGVQHGCVATCRECLKAEAKAKEGA